MKSELSQQPLCLWMQNFLLTFILQFHLDFFGGPGPVSNSKEKKTNGSKRTAVTQCLGLTLIIRSFVTGLVSGAVTGVANLRV